MNKGQNYDDTIRQFINKPLLVHPAYFELFIANTVSNSMARTDRAQSRNILTINNNVAIISIRGLLRKSAPILSWSDYTLYSEIIDAIAKAEQSSATKIIINIDSPGGDVSGLDITASAIASTKKITVARVDNLAASAAYWLASQADTIMAASPTARFGSIGVVARVTDWSKFDEKFGIVTHQIISSKSPKKAPDITTKEGRSQIQSELDDLLDVFVTRVAQGRRVEKDYVYSDFGAGDVLIADKALAVGMIDSVQWSSDVIKNGNQFVEQQILKPTKGNVMEKNYEQGLLEGKALGREEGLLEGANRERDRVTKLLGWMDTPGAVGIAMDAIRSGDSEQDILGQLIRASHLPSEAVHRQAENAEAVDTTGFESSTQGEDEQIQAAVRNVLKHSAEVRNV